MRPARSAVLFVALSTAACGCFGSSGGDQRDEVVVSVRTVVATRAPLAETATAAGTVGAKREAVLSTPLPGQLAPLGLLTNTEVHEGDVLASIDAVDFIQADKDLRQAKASVASLDRLASKRRALLEQGGISRKDVEETELDLANAQADLRASERIVAALGGRAAVDASGRATVRAPFDGVLVEQMTFGGEFVPEGTPVLRIADLSEFLVRARFPDTVGPRISEGSEAFVEDEAIPGEPVAGVVASVSRATDPASRTAEVWVRVPGEGALRLGDGARVTAVVASESSALVVPRVAVQLDSPTGDEGTVMVVDADSVAHETHVKVGLRTADTVQVVDGLTDGQVVIVEGNYALPDGTKVEVQPPEAPVNDP